MEFSVFTTCVETKVSLTVSSNRSVLHLLHPEIYRREDDSQSTTYEVSERFEELSIDGANGIIAVTFGACAVVISRFVLDRRYRDDENEKNCDFLDAITVREQRKHEEDAGRTKSGSIARRNSIDRSLRVGRSIRFRLRSRTVEMRN